jgi:acetylornithine deacetylase/succinyl-diaminopimelate desuccinylase-like protein
LIVVQKYLLKLLQLGSTLVDPELDVFQLYKTTLGKHYCREIEVKGTYGSGDARHVNKYGIPFLMSNPEAWDSHGDNERVSISSIVTFYYALVEFLGEYEQVFEKK